MTTATKSFTDHRTSASAAIESRRAKETAQARLTYTSGIIAEAKHESFDDKTTAALDAAMRLLGIGQDEFDADIAAIRTATAAEADIALEAERLRLNQETEKAGAEIKAAEQCLKEKRDAWLMASAKEYAAAIKVKDGESVLKRIRASNPRAFGNWNPSPQNVEPKPHPGIGYQTVERGNVAATVGVP